MEKNSKIYVAGHRGLVGSALVENLKSKGFNNLILRTRQEVDLLDHNQVDSFFNDTKPEYVFMSAAKVGGIKANLNFPVEFLYENLQIQLNVIRSAAKYNVKKLIFLGSVCVYPKHARNPIKEECLLTGELEPSNEPYAIAKIAGIKLCQSYKKQYGCNFISAMPVNLYGKNDNFDLETSHVIPALIHKFHDAKIKNLPEVVCWGNGFAKREFMYSKDCADALVYIMNNYDGDIINIGCEGSWWSVESIAYIIKDVIGYKGKVVWSNNSLDGAPLRTVNPSKLKNMGWLPTYSLHDGISETYQWFLEHYNSQSKNFKNLIAEK